MSNASASRVSAAPTDLGRELQLCPRRRPGLVWAISSLVLGGCAAVLLIGLVSGGQTKASDLTFVGVLVAIFGGTGALMLALRKRTLARREMIHIHEHGLVREDRRSRRELRFADVDRLQARITVTGVNRMYAIALRARGGKKTTILSLWFDNVDEALIALLAERTGLRVEPL